MPIRRVLDVRAALKSRRFGPKMRAALLELDRQPVRSFRWVASRHGVDLGELHRNARTVAGLLEARRAAQSAGRPGRAGAAA